MAPLGTRMGCAATRLVLAAWPHAAFILRSFILGWHCHLCCPPGDQQVVVKVPVLAYRTLPPCQRLAVPCLAPDLGSSKTKRCSFQYSKEDVFHQGPHLSLHYTSPL